MSVWGCVCFKAIASLLKITQMKNETDGGSNPSPPSECLYRPLHLSDVNFHICKVGLMYPTGCQEPESMLRAPNSMPSTQ